MKRGFILLILFVLLFTSVFGMQAYGEMPEETKQQKSNLDEISVTSLSYDGLEYGYHNFSATVKNNTDSILSSIDLAFILLDSENNIVSTTYPQENTRVRPGQSIRVSAQESEDTKATSFNVDFCSYIDEKGEFLTHYFQQTPQNMPLSVSTEQSQMRKDSTRINEESDEPISVVSLSYDGLEYDYHHFSVNVRNNTDSTINTISVTFVLLDDNSTIVSATYPQEPVRIKPGQSICVSALESKDTSATCFNVDSCSYYDENNNIQEHYFLTIPENMPLAEDREQAETHNSNVSDSNRKESSDKPQEEKSIDSEILRSEVKKTKLTDNEKIDALVFLITLEDQFGDNLSDDDFDKLLKIVADRFGVTPDDIFNLTGDVDCLKKAYSRLQNPKGTEIKQYDATLEYGDGMVLVFASEEAMERYMTALNKGHQGTLYELFLNGEVSYTAKGTKCNIINSRLTRAQVKLLEGSHSGSTVWVIIEAIHER